MAWAPDAGEGAVQPTSHDQGMINHLLIRPSPVVEIAIQARAFCLTHTVTRSDVNLMGTPRGYDP